MNILGRLKPSSSEQSEELKNSRIDPKYARRNSERLDLKFKEFAQKLENLKYQIETLNSEFLSNKIFKRNLSKQNVMTIQGILSKINQILNSNLKNETTSEFYDDLERTKTQEENIEEKSIGNLNKTYELFKPKFIEGINFCKKASQNFEFSENGTLLKSEETLEQLSSTKIKSKTNPEKTEDYFGLSEFKDGIFNYIETEIFHPKRLFENFFVLGPNKKNIEKAIIEKKVPLNFFGGNQVQLHSEVLYDYAKHNKMNMAPVGEAIKDFLCPNGLTARVYRIESRKVQNFIGKILFKSSRKLKKKFQTFINPHLERIIISKWHPFIENINPQNKLYCYCQIIGDYVILNETGKETYFMYCETAYCFVTYYPMPELFFNLLNSILKFTKFKRNVNLSNEITRFQPSHYDLLSLVPILEKEISMHLIKLLTEGIPRSLKKIEYSLKSEQNKSYYVFPDFSKNCNGTSHYNMESALESLGLRDILTLVEWIILEKSIVFFCENQITLHSVIDFLLKLIYPLKYSCTIITSLPRRDDYLTFLEAPTPIIIGINQHSNYFWKKDFAKFKEQIFVFLDEKIIYNPQNCETTFEFLYDEACYLHQNFGNVETNYKISDSLSVVQQWHKQNFKKLFPIKYLPKFSYSKYFEYFQKMIEEYILFPILKATKFNSKAGNSLNKHLLPDHLISFGEQFKRTQIYTNMPTTLACDFKNSIEEILFV